MPNLERQDEVLDGLVLDAQACSPGAFTRLWEASSPPVVAYLRGRGVRDVDDVTSEVFLAALQVLGSDVTSGAGFRRVLFAFAHRRAVEAWRERAQNGTEVSVSSELLAGLRALAREPRPDVLDVLGRLPDDQRNVLLLRVVADLPVPDVAAVLGRSPDAVKQLHHRALARLRRAVTRNSSSCAGDARRPSTIAPGS